MPEAELLCATPGRLRLRWQALGSEETTTAVQAALRDLPGLTDVDVSAPRRRLLVRFDPAVTSLTRLLGILMDLGAIVTHPASPAAARDGTFDGRAVGRRQLPLARSLEKQSPTPGRACSPIEAASPAPGRSGRPD